MDTKNQNQKIKTAPKPEYGLCNAGHQLVPVFSPRFNMYVWDCPTCIEAQKKAYEDEAIIRDKVELGTYWDEEEF